MKAIRIHFSRNATGAAGSREHRRSCQRRFPRRKQHIVIQPATIEREKEK
jgi:hypothetical protein